MVDNLLIGSIENSRQMTLRHGHAHRVAESLPQGARSGLHAGGMAVFGMAGGFAAPLAKVFNIFQTDLVTGQVKQAVKQHGGVAGRQHEAVAIHPCRVLGVMLQYPGPQHIGGGRQAHGCSGMPGICRLHGIHRQGSNGVDTQIIEGGRFYW